MAVLQESTSLCGPACLEFVLAQIGQDVSISKILLVTPHSPEGTTYSDLAQGAAAQGLNPCLLKIAATELERLVTLTGQPVIVAVRGSHFICVIEAVYQWIFAFDPNVGRITISADELCQQWDGRALAFDRSIIHDPTLYGGISHPNRN